MQILEMDEQFSLKRKTHIVLYSKQSETNSKSLEKIFRNTVKVISVLKKPVFVVLV
jgi:hypothetical protein